MVAKEDAGSVGPGIVGGWSCVNAWSRAEGLVLVALDSGAVAVVLALALLSALPVVSVADLSGLKRQRSRTLAD